MDASGGESKVPCCKEQFCIGTWNVKSMNHDKLDVVNQEMARLSIDILGHQMWFLCSLMFLEYGYSIYGLGGEEQKITGAG